MNQTIYHLEAQDIAGRTIHLSDYRGKVILIVNTASKCGFTPQFGGLEELYEKYRKEGFEIIGFPSSQFFQEPNSGEGIEEFCQVNYGVTFKMMDKVKVLGWGKHPVYRFLSDSSLNGVINSAPKWNFYKYLINRQGKVVALYPSTTSPMDTELIAAIEQCLAEKV
jgi:glutathione peroxidase